MLQRCQSWSQTLLGTVWANKQFNRFFHYWSFLLKLRKVFEMKPLKQDQALTWTMKARESGFSASMNLPPELFLNRTCHEKIDERISEGYSGVIKLEFGAFFQRQRSEKTADISPCGENGNGPARTTGKGRIRAPKVPAITRNGVTEKGCGMDIGANLLYGRRVYVLPARPARPINSLFRVFTATVRASPGSIAIKEPAE